jgi:hypothetical protein
MEFVMPAGIGNSLTVQQSSLQQYNNRPANLTGRFHYNEHFDNTRNYLNSDQTILSAQYPGQGDLRSGSPSIESS